MRRIEGGDAVHVDQVERLHTVAGDAVPGESPTSRRRRRVRSGQAPVRDLVAAVLTVAGVALVAAGAFVASTVAGLLVTGALLLGLGLALGLHTGSPAAAPAGTALEVQRDRRSGR